MFYNIYACLITLQFDFYKVVRAYTVVLHVYEQFEIDHMKNKTFMSFIQIIPTTFDKKKYLLASRYNFSVLIRSDPRSRSQNKFRSVHCTRFYDVYSAKETHFRKEAVFPIFFIFSNLLGKTLAVWINTLTSETSIHACYRLRLPKKIAPYLISLTFCEVI